ncbi:MucR family transcriptional regulator [Methylobacterium gnaphalii]|uniref:Transcriptional regulator n=1 Tax=Methylobacterium gnaphalii TaxID=1010610 RepID=A0A512JEC8_9HYPH|nr:MucR family transcriptional regulator [Methylobacterium gnaphalii]GEP08279.1 transcriptional regulator [Methylobacterium gnaphalii]GJD67945.1 Transcriptional regulatory protein ros [Methylobacterium gnaphalii]GLS51090.1 transcriptional regulator [Methylobacterium gnaphalii]
MNEAETPVDFVELAADIVSAYVSNNPVPPAELPQLLGRVHGALIQVASGTAPESTAPAQPQQPAVPIKKSVTNEYIVCLEDGRTFKSLKRHLRAKYNLSPEQYRAKWGLPPDYPMVAPSYAKARSDLAKAIGLGQTRGGDYDEAA